MTADAHTAEKLDWETAADEVCREVGGRVVSLTREVAENIYAEIMISVEDYLRDNEIGRAHV